MPYSRFLTPTAHSYHCYGLHRRTFLTNFAPMTFKHFIYPIIAFSAAIATACGDSHDPAPEPQPAHRTVLVYMAANNNLSYNAIADINEIKEGVNNGSGLGGGRLLIYLTLPGTEPRLMEIDGNGNEHTVKKYSDDQTSLTVSRMKEVIADTKQEAPAIDYGLVLWSHGTGWLNDDGVIDEQPTAITPQSFGQDGTGYNPKRMKISSLASALSDSHFSFIYFDCCHMATVEVVYELRHAADHIIASATELSIDGMPYQLNIPTFFKTTPDIVQAATNTYRLYADDPSSVGCSITVIDTDALEPLAQATRDIFATSPQLPQDYTPVRYFRTTVMSTGIFDMHHYIHHLSPASDLTARWQAAFDRAVTLHLTTPTVYYLPAQNFRGLGMHIVTAPDDATIYGYAETAWWRDVASTLFP